MVYATASRRSDRQSRPALRRGSGVYQQERPRRNPRGARGSTHHAAVPASRFRRSVVQGMQGTPRAAGVRVRDRGLLLRQRHRGPRPASGLAAAGAIRGEYWRFQHRPGAERPRRPPVEPLGRLVLGEPVDVAQLAIEQQPAVHGLVGARDLGELEQLLRGLVGGVFQQRIACACDPLAGIHFVDVEAGAVLRPSATTIRLPGPTGCAPAFSTSGHQSVACDGQPVIGAHLESGWGASRSRLYHMSARSYECSRS